MGLQGWLQGHLDDRQPQQYLSSRGERDLSVRAGVKYDAGFHASLAVDEPNLERPMSLVMRLQDTMRHRRTGMGPKKNIIGVRDEWDRGNEDTGVPPCPRVGLHGAVRG